jgi:probable rRNA maturation factor
VPLDVDALVMLARETLRGEGLGAAELSVSFVETDEIEELQVRYMDEPGPTDVLSFPLDADDVDEDGVRLLGDVVIAPSVAAANNPGAPDQELRLLLVHGILHLLGYDHEEDGEKAEMWARQERYSGVSAP